MGSLTGNGQFNTLGGIAVNPTSGQVIVDDRVNSLTISCGDNPPTTMQSDALKVKVHSKGS